MSGAQSTQVSQLTDVDSLKAELKKLSQRATQSKMDLHDLSEELPQNWSSILSVAQRAYEAFAALEAKRAELQKLET